MVYGSKLQLVKSLFRIGLGPWGLFRLILGFIGSWFMVYLDRIGLGCIEICFGDVRVGLKISWGWFTVFFQGLVMVGLEFIRGWFKVYVGLIYGYLWCV